MIPAAVTPTISPDHWFYVGFPFVFYGTVVLVLFLAGEHGEERNPIKIFFRRISWSLERGTGYPAWSMAGILTGLMVLAVAAMGLYWDVAWHIDLGRDRQLMTPSHTMIVLGLGGLVAAAVISVIFATLDKADVGLRVLGLRIPWSSLGLAALGAGGVAAFPLDALWHEAYGVDVTLWSPTHLQLVAGGSLATISMWLMLAEGRRHATNPTWFVGLVHATVAGATLTGLSTFQGEFDFGVPQFQVLYLPLLVAVAAGMAIVCARITMGPGGALAAVAAFLVLRGTIALLVGVSLNHTVPRFPLYLAAGVAVEVVALLVGTHRPVRFAVVSGAVIAVVETVAQSVWADLSGWYEPLSSPGMVARVVVLVPVVAVAAALLGAGLARAFSGRAVPGRLLLGAGVAIVAVFAYPLPRNVGDVHAVVRTQAAGAGERVHVEVQLEPPGAASRATAFGVVAWQGGGRISSSLEEAGRPGLYRTTKPVPVDGPWKTVVGLQRGDEVMSVPVYLPADPAIGAPEVPLLAERRERFVRNTTWLLRETHDGPAWPAFAAYAGVGLISVLWVALFALAVVKIAGRREADGGQDLRDTPGGERAEPEPAAPAPAAPAPAQPEPEPAGGRYRPWARQPA